MAGIALQSCSSDNIGAEEPVNPNNGEQYYSVSLTLDGINVSEEPLSRAGDDDGLKTIYKILVYYDRNKDGDVSYKYAEGTFDNVNSMQLSMLAGHKYRFLCSLWKQITGDVELAGFNGFSDIANKFHISQDYNKSSSLVPGLYQGVNVHGSWNSIYRRDISRYYGELRDYSPTQNGKAIIKMIEASYFGLHITINPPSEGLLYVQDGASNHYSYYAYSGQYDSDTKSYYQVKNESFVYKEINNTSPVYDDGGILFIVGESVMNHWSDVTSGKTIDENVQNLEINIRWVNYNDAGVQIGNSSTKKTITLKRGVMTNVNIDLNINNADTRNANIGFTYEDSKEMTTSNEKWTVNVNNDGTMDVTVKPE